MFFWLSKSKNRVFSQGRRWTVLGRPVTGLPSLPDQHFIFANHRAEMYLIWFLFACPWLLQWVGTASHMAIAQVSYSVICTYKLCNFLLIYSTCKADIVFHHVNCFFPVFMLLLDKQVLNMKVVPFTNLFLVTSVADLSSFTFCSCFHLWA